MAAVDHEVTLITRAGCHLCEEAEVVLRRLRGELGFDYAELDVDADPAVWSDTVDEVVTMFEPRQVRLGRIAPVARGVALVADDDPGRWLLGAHQPVEPVTRADVTVSGPARSLALVLWHRLTPEDAGVRTQGDRAALTEVLATRITP